MRRRESHPGRGRGRTGRRRAAQLRGLALRLANTLAEAQPILHTPQDSQPGPVFLPHGYLVIPSQGPVHISSSGLSGNSQPGSVFLGLR